MTIIREVKDWKFFKDDTMGVTAFSNESIGFQSDWNTGSDAEEEIESVSNMTDIEFMIYGANLIQLPF